MQKIKAIRFDTSIAAPHVVRACECIVKAVNSQYVTAAVSASGDIVFHPLDCHAGEEVEKAQALERLQEALDVMNGTAFTNRARHAQVRYVVDDGEKITAICFNYKGELLFTVGVQSTTPVLNNAEFAAWVFDRIKPKTYLPDVLDMYKHEWQEFKNTSFRDESASSTDNHTCTDSPVVADVFQHLLAQLEFRISKSPTARYFQSPAVTAIPEGAYVPFDFSVIARLAAALVFAGTQEQNNDFVCVQVQCPNSQECVDAIIKSLPIGRIRVRTFEPAGAVVFTQLDNMHVTPILMSNPPQVQLSARVIMRRSVNPINQAYTMLCSESLPKLMAERTIERTVDFGMLSFGQTFSQPVPPGIPSFSNSPLLGAGMYATPPRIPSAVEIAQMLMTSSNFNQVFEALYMTTDGQNKMQAVNALMLKFIDDVMLAEQKIKSQSAQYNPNGGMKQF